MRNVRIIARLDVKGPNLIKGVHLEGLRVVGDPYLYAKKHYEAGADELIYMDVVASLYGRNNLTDVVRKTAQDVFVPMTVGGGVRSVDDALMLLRAGADKVAINTAATQRPELITEISQQFGAQCVVLSIEAKRTAQGKWMAYSDNGRIRTGMDVIEWAQRGVELGAGEILLTSIDQEGTLKGFDVELCEAVTAVVERPVILSGGMGTLDHARDALQRGNADALAVAHVLHYDKHSLSEIHQATRDAGFNVRKVS